MVKALMLKVNPIYTISKANIKDQWEFGYFPKKMLAEIVGGTKFWIGQYHFGSNSYEIRS